MGRRAITPCPLLPVANKQSRLAEEGAQLGVRLALVHLAPPWDAKLPQLTQALPGTGACCAVRTRPWQDRAPQGLWPQSWRPSESGWGEAGRDPESDGNYRVTPMLPRVPGISSLKLCVALETQLPCPPKGGGAAGHASSSSSFPDTAWGLHSRSPSCKMPQPHRIEEPPPPFRCGWGPG